MVLELPTDTMWMLDNSSGEWMVIAAGRTPKAVSKLMKLKRVKTCLGSRMLLWVGLGPAGGVHSSNFPKPTGCLKGIWLKLRHFEGI